MDPSLIVGPLLGIAMLGFLLAIRTKDIPEPAPVSPFRHLEERKAAIYEGLRDLQFEYRLDKLSDADYQASKVQLQKELAQVMAETDRIKAAISAGGTVAAVVVDPHVCPSCGAKFKTALKFCGECGKPMGATS